MIVLLAYVLAISSIGMIYTIHTVYAHYFSKDDRASFLALIHQINAEIQLTNTDFPSNVSIAIEHAENTASIIFNSFLLLTSVVLIEFMIALTLSLYRFG